MVNKKLAVIDSGTMITFSSTCLMNVFVNFVKKNNLELIVSNDVASESVWKPIRNKKFSLNAARIKHLFNSGVVKVISSNDSNKLEEKILSIANKCFYSKGKSITIIQRGEAEALALAKIHGSNILFIDERTTRALFENPLRLKQVLEKRRGQNISINRDKISLLKEMFSGLKIFRSVDIIAFAHQQGLFNGELDHGKLELEAALYATKFAGCSVSEREIEDYLSSN